MELKKQGPVFVGITGGSASGKTTFIKKLSEIFNENQICVISQDHYYKPLSEQIQDENGEVNFDLPEAIDFDRLLKDIKQLQKGQQVELVEYTFNNPKKFPKKLTWMPRPIIIIEGLFIFYHPKVAKVFDLKLFIEANQEVMLKRRLSRDFAERAMTKEQILYQWNNHVKPSYDKYLLPYREDVDMIIMNNTHFDNSLNIIVNHFNTFLI
jgi:uridine kinase